MPSPTDCDLPSGAVQPADRRGDCSDQLERISACTELARELTKSADGGAVHDVRLASDRSMLRHDRSSAGRHVGRLTDRAFSWRVGKLRLPSLLCKWTSTIPQSRVR